MSIPNTMIRNLVVSFCSIAGIISILPTASISSKSNQISAEAFELPSIEDVENALKVLNSAGINTERLCHDGLLKESYNTVFSSCSQVTLNQMYVHRHKRFQEAETEETGIEENGEIGNWEGGTNKDDWFYIKNGIGAFSCVVIAALAAGLTMGLLSLELLDLKITEYSSNSPQEIEQARSLMPLLKDHHLLLVTLLLCNAMANEALPLFLDEIVPSYVAVILSVTLVLFFGEIIPSAIFSGPNKVAVSSKLAPLVKILLRLLYPVAWPIARLLDTLLHSSDEDSLFKYDRKELSALVRIQYQERMAAKQHRSILRASIRSSAKIVDVLSKNGIPDGHSNRSQVQKDDVHMDEDEVVMVEGALKMKNTCVSDVMTPLHEVFAIPHDMTLNEENIVDIYCRGYSRLPIYDNAGAIDDESSQKSIYKIKGVFNIRQLIVVNPEDSRLISTMPYQKPHCISPTTDMLEAVNLLQTGRQGDKGGHMAIVCMNPDAANDALKKDEYIPASAGITGIVTLEDCLENLIQEEIYDECDKEEMIRDQRARWVIKAFKRLVKQKKERLLKEGKTTSQSSREEKDKLLSSSGNANYATSGMELNPLV